MAKPNPKIAHLTGSGVYYILNTRNDRIYVGQTGHIFARCRDHLNNLVGNRHPNYWLQADWNEYGADTFEFGVLIECEGLWKCRTCEQIFIRVYQSEDRRYGYNLPRNGYYRSAAYRNRELLISRLTYLELAV